MRQTPPLRVWVRRPRRGVALEALRCGRLNGAPPSRPITSPPDLTQGRKQAERIQGGPSRWPSRWPSRGQWPGRQWQRVLRTRPHGRRPEGGVGRQRGSNADRATLARSPMSTLGRPLPAVLPFPNKRRKDGGRRAWERRRFRRRRRQPRPAKRTPRQPLGRPRGRAGPSRDPGAWAGPRAVSCHVERTLPAPGRLQDWPATREASRAVCAADPLQRTPGFDGGAGALAGLRTDPLAHPSRDRLRPSPASRAGGPRRSVCAPDAPILPPAHPHGPAWSVVLQPRCSRAPAAGAARRKQKVGGWLVTAAAAAATAAAGCEARAERGSVFYPIRTDRPAPGRLGADSLHSSTRCGAQWMYTSSDTCASSRGD